MSKEKGKVILGENIEKELDKYSKEALIKAIVDNSIFRGEAILVSARHAEFEIVQKKQEMIMEELSKLNPVYNFKRYKELDAKYRRYDKQISKLLRL